MKSPLILVFLTVTTYFASVGLSQSRAPTVSPRSDGAAQIRFGDGRAITVPKEPGQTGISDPQAADDGTVGWLVEYSVDGVSYSIPGSLVIWRANHIVRRFRSGQTFYSWAFYAQGRQVAYHIGPLHGEQKQHCELRDVATGRKVAIWDGDLDSPGGRPAWTEGLNH